MMKRHIPNLITLLNLGCGVTAIVLTLEGQWRWGVYLILVASVLDFMDGLAARLLNAGSDTGKQLDSLADMVTFGTLPAIFIYTIFKEMPVLPLKWFLLCSILLVPVFSAIRLARFNAREKNNLFFQGLPTPAHALFWTGIFWQFMGYGNIFGTRINIYFMWAIMLIMALHMIIPIPMYAIRFEHFRIRGNLIRYLIIVVSVLILVFTGISGLSLVVLSYMLFSLVNLLLQLRVQ